MKKSILAALALALLTVGPALAQQAAGENAAAKEQDVRRLLELTGSAKLGKQVLTQMFEAFKQGAPEVPASTWDEMLKEFDADSMIELIVPIYAKHLTHEDVKGLIAFYESPLGRKMTDLLPAITQESMQAGQQWGMEVAQKVQKRLAEKKKSSSGK
ncbi:MAG: DUF2059 domain-containing protein [Thermoanaerobaculia bacterium]